MDEKERWDSERAFFDAEEYDETALPPAVVARYQECRKPWLAPEFNYRVLGDVRGKRIVEVACGDGSNSILLGLKGAIVTGVDISPKAIEVATRRAALHGISDRVRFYASPFELFKPADGEKFDIVCGWASMHHWLAALDPMMASIVELSRPQARIMFHEPIATWQWLRSFRLMLPIRTDGTPDERPLNQTDLAIVRKYVPDLRVEYHNALLRVVNRFSLKGRYEDMTRSSRAVYDVLGRTDNFLLNTVGLSGFASSATMYGTVKK